MGARCPPRAFALPPNPKRCLPVEDSLCHRTPNEGEDRPVPLLTVKISTLTPVPLGLGASPDGAFNLAEQGGEESGGVPAAAEEGSGTGVTIRASGLVQIFRSNIPCTVKHPYDFQRG